MQLVVTTLYATALAVQALVLCLLGWQLLPAILGARPIGLLIALVAAPAAIPVVLALRRKLSAEALIPRRLFTEDPLLALGSATLALIAIWLTARAFGDRGGVRERDARRQSAVGFSFGYAAQRFDGIQDSATSAGELNASPPASHGPRSRSVGAGRLAR